MKSQDPFWAALHKRHAQHMADEFRRDALHPITTPVSARISHELADRWQGKADHL